MKTPLGLTLAIAGVAAALAQNPAQPAARSYFVDAQTPQGLRELFAPTSDPLPLISAHRGGAARGWPENCLATFQATVQHGWSMLEIDLHATKDGAIILMHDPTLDRTSNGKGRIQDHTLEELRQLRLKDRQGNLSEYRIPTLSEVMEWARGKTILVLDKKEMPAPAVARIVREHRAEAYAMVMTYSSKDIKECHAQNPDLMMEVMLGTRERFEEFDASGVPWNRIIAFVGHTQTPDVELCRRIRAKGASCMAGTSRNVDRQFLNGSVTTMEKLRPEYRAVLDRGVDLLETDIPRELAPLLYPTLPTTGTKARFFRISPNTP